VRAGCEIGMGFTFCRGTEGGKIEEGAVATSNGRLQGCSRGRYHIWREGRWVSRESMVSGKLVPNEIA
jgi:hypothetical protein